MRISRLVPLVSVRIVLDNNQKNRNCPFLISIPSHPNANESIEIKTNSLVEEELWGDRWCVIMMLYRLLYSSRKEHEEISIDKEQRTMR
jgi:hypothetical protein